MKDDGLDFTSFGTVIAEIKHMETLLQINVCWSAVLHLSNEAAHLFAQASRNFDVNTASTLRTHKSEIVLCME